MKVLFATDGAEPSEHAAHLLARLADPVRTAVTVLSVNDFDVRCARRAEGHYSTEEGHEAAHRAADGATEASIRGLRTRRGRVEDGDEASEIVHAADRDLELVVVGTGRNELARRVVLGSVSSSVVHAAVPRARRPRAPEPDRACE